MSKKQGTSLKCIHKQARCYDEVTTIIKKDSSCQIFLLGIFSWNTLVLSCVLFFWKEGKKSEKKILKKIPLRWESGIFKWPWSQTGKSNCVLTSVDKRLFNTQEAEVMRIVHTMHFFPPFFSVLFQ